MKLSYFVLALIFLTGSPITFAQRAAGAGTSTNAAANTPTKVDLEAWQKAILAGPTTKDGCYTVKYPSTVWQEVKCGPPPTNRYQCDSTSGSCPHG
jgi:hypothetical protein